MIRLLPGALVNKIAAGEVIVRPASVVKELVENSLDAGATRIAVEVGNGCRDLRVRDDGCGIAPEDAPLALVRHATSKIGDFDDLWSLATRGFRGEALASISAVARVQVLTRRPADLAGNRITAEGGEEPRIESAGAPEGTDVRVRDLFFNTPARLKFMKTPSAELQQVIAVVTRQALSRPDVGFTVSGPDGTALLDVPPGEPWEERVTALLGSQVAGKLLAVDAEAHGVRVRGFAALPSVSRKDRRQQHFFVGGRPVTSRNLSFVLQEAYRGLVMVQRFPVAVLDITLPPGEVDINVHPTKEEVRFRNEQAAAGAIHRAVRARLRAANLMPQADLGGEGGESGARPAGAVAAEIPFGPSEFAGGPPAPPAGAGAMPVDFARYTSGLAHPLGAGASAPGGGGVSTQHLERSAAEVARADTELDALTALVGMAAAGGGATMGAGAGGPETDAASFTEGEGGVPAPCAVRPMAHSLAGVDAAAGADPAGPTSAALLRDGQPPEPLGQVGACYIVARCGQDLLLIDQHAAHERLLYLELVRRTGPPPTQDLLIPLSIDVPPEAMPLMDAVLPVLAQQGMRVEPFGGRTFLVQSVPADLPNFDPAAVVSDLLDDLGELGRAGAGPEAVRDRVVTRMACRAAVKAGQRLGMEEMRALIRSLVAARLAFTCPHGRPTMILLTRDQLDRQFKRKL